MSGSQIASDAHFYDVVWGSFTAADGAAQNNPPIWRSNNAQTFVSRYYIISEDNKLVSGRDINYWLQHNPTSILYACDSSGNPTRDYAYTPGDGFADVPLNIHDQSVVNYQVGSLLNFVKNNGYNAFALDEVIFHNYMLGGNPKLGQSGPKAGEYGCGTWDSTFTNFTKIYSGPNDPTFTADVLNWVHTAQQTAAQNGIFVVVNHPAPGSINANEQSLVSYADVLMDETAFTDYGNYIKAPGYFNQAYNWMEYVQRQGKASIIINKFAQNGQQIVTQLQLEYSIATYLMANEGNADVFSVANNPSGYGAEQYHSQYATNMGRPCSPMSGTPHMRRYEHGLAIVNNSLSSVQATLPNHQYSDVFGRSVSNPLTVNGADAYVLTTGANGCQ